MVCANVIRMSLASVSLAIVSQAILLTVIPAALQAQESAALEEIVVTAQRRVQSLQEVPLSIETYSGIELEAQGYRDMEDLSVFAPSVVVQSGVLDQEITIRGFGTTGNSQTLEQATPIFIDGIHYGRQAMIKTAFLDADRVEVLKGPQPVFFGMNATAGAISIISRKPTTEWEGYALFERGNMGRFEASGAVGGPLTETLGIRVAAISEQDDGYLEHPVTGGQFPKYESLGGRVILQWTPTDNFEAVGKIEGSELRRGSEAVLLCHTGDSALYPSDAGQLDEPEEVDGVPIVDEGWEATVWVDPPLGEGWSVPHQPIGTYPNCFEGNVTPSWEGPYFDPPVHISGNGMRTGMPDIRNVAEAFYSSGSDGIEGFDTDGIDGKDFIDSWTGMLDMTYELGNGFEIASTSGFVDFLRTNSRDDRAEPFFGNLANRQEDFRQWSSELRLSSPTDGHDMGAANIDWMVGVFMQSTEKDNVSSMIRANTRQPLRFNWIVEDSTWQAGFATVTVNFLDDKASIDVGGRIARIEKEVDVRGYGSTFIYDVRPCAATPDDDIGGGNFDPETCPLAPGAIQIDPATDNPRILVDFLDNRPVDMTNLWTMPWRTEILPSSWRGGRTAAVGLTAPDFSVREGPHHDQFSVSEFDPQVTLRYRPTPDHSFFARWATAFKAAGYDTGLASIPDSLEEMKFDHEYAETMEVGVKGTFWEGRGRYDVTLFQTTFEDLQLSGLADVTDPDETSISLNAGEQRTRGIEFSATAAVTDQLTLNLAGAIMDAEMTDFRGSGCNDQEFVVARDNLDIPELQGCDLVSFDDPLIDRSGQQAPRAPDWKYVASVDYWLPVSNDHQLTFNAQGYISDGFITDRSGFSRVVMFNQHEDLNLKVGFGDRDDVWEVTAYARNILEPRQSYNREFDVIGQRTGFVEAEARRSEFVSYGLSFRYNYR